MTQEEAIEIKMTIRRALVPSHRNIQALFWIVVLMCSTERLEALSETIDLKHGTLELPHGFKVVTERGVDSRVGKIVSHDGKMIVGYDVGKMAGRWADPKKPKEKYVWLRKGKENGQRYYYALSRQGFLGLCVTFPDAGPTNFFVEGISSEEEIQRVLEIVLKFKKKPR